MNNFQREADGTIPPQQAELYFPEKPLFKAGEVCYALPDAARGRLIPLTIIDATHDSIIQLVNETGDHVSYKRDILVTKKQAIDLGKIFKGRV